MLIDWFTVGAQALNFVILAWLMKRFLYKPILTAIDAREKRIASELAAAGRKKIEAQQERAEFQKKNDDFDKQRDALLEKAAGDASAERGKLMEAARQSANALTATRRDDLAREATALAQSVRQRAQVEVFAIARRTLADLAGAGLEAGACQVFIGRLHGLEGQPRNDLAAALAGTHDGVLVRSAFELPSAQRLAIHTAIADDFGVELELRYETAPALVSGIELVAQGRKVAWTISDYLASLEQGVSDVLKAQQQGPAPTPGPGPAPAPAPSPTASAATRPALAAGGAVTAAPAVTQ